jgi:hypothetical protein
MEPCRTRACANPAVTYPRGDAVVSAGYCRSCLSRWARRGRGRDDRIRAALERKLGRTLSPHERASSRRNPDTGRPRVYLRIEGPASEVHCPHCGRTYEEDATDDR